LPESYPFTETLSRLDEIDTWLRSVGQGSHDRVRHSRKNIQEMIELQTHDQIEADIEAIKNTPLEKAREILWSYVEAHEFVAAVDPLRANLGDDFPLSPVAKALEGPADLFLENQRNNQGRNFMFELVMGGRLAAAGLRPSFDRGPDLEVEFAGLRVAVQCKRPLSQSGLEANINKAISQLKTDNAELSLVAVSVSRLLNPGDLGGIPEVAQAELAHAHLQERVRKIADETRRFWRGKLDRAGILFYAFMPIRWLQASGHYGHIMERCEIMCPIATGEPTETLLRCLARSLGA
jgi:hypothetical protein